MEAMYGIPIVRVKRLGQRIRGNRRVFYCYSEWCGGREISCGTRIDYAATRECGDCRKRRTRDSTPPHASSPERFKNFNEERP